MDRTVLKPSRRERGSALEWTAVVFATLVLPLMMLMVDIPRLVYLRDHLQTAADVACESAAQAGLDWRAYGANGVLRVQRTAAARSVGQAAFRGVVQDAGLQRYTPALVIRPHDARTLLCRASATFPWLIHLAGGTMHIQVTAYGRAVAPRP